LLLALLQLLEKLLGSLDCRLARLLRLRWLFPLRLVGLLVGRFAGIRNHILCRIIIIRSVPSIHGLGDGLLHAALEPSLLDRSLVTAGFRDKHDSIEPSGIVLGSNQNIIEMGSVEQRGHDISGWAWTKPAHHPLSGVSRDVDRCSRLSVHRPQNIA